MDYEAEYLKLIKTLKHCADGDYISSERENMHYREGLEDGEQTLAEEIISAARESNPEFFAKHFNEGV